MNNWFECKVKYTKIDEQTGKEKRVTEPYLIDAISFTEAEKRMTEEAEKIVSGEFQITNISKSKISDTFFYDDGDWWYKCKVSIVDVDESSGKEKKTANTMLILAGSVKEAFERLEESLASVIVPYEIEAIVKSPIVELFPYFSEEENQEIPENLKPLSEVIDNNSFEHNQMPENYEENIENDAKETTEELSEHGVIEAGNEQNDESTDVETLEEDTY